jgi:Cytochrome c oxidase subunit III
LTQHHDIKLLDNSLLEGKILDRTFDIPFEGKSVEFKLAGSSPGFFKDIQGSFPKFKAEWKEYAEVEGKWMMVDKTANLNSASEFHDWFVKARSKATADLVKERGRYRKEIDTRTAALYKKVEAITPTGPQVNQNVKMTAETPFQLHSRRRQVRPIQKQKDHDILTYIDGCVVSGKAGDDRVKFEPHVVDMQLVPLHKQKDSMVWNVLGDSHLKDAWFKNRDASYQEMEHYYAPRNKEIPESMLRGYYINIQSIHDKTHAKPFFKEFAEEFLAGVGIGGGNHEKHDDHKVPATEAHDAHAGDEHHSILIPRDQIKFLNSHGPRNGNYYAIYFTMTALHGLHVIGGALVLLYFVVFGKKLYLKNPEHLANRVEVGGLFWHFVDLIWIFLFPLMYLI